MATKNKNAMAPFVRMCFAAGVRRDQLLNFRNGGYAPQHTQARFHAAARDADEPDGPDQIGFGGARGGGKTHASFAQLCLDDCQRQPGLKALMLRKIGKAVQETVQDLRLTVLKHTPHEYKRAERVLQFPNGSRVVLGNFKDEKDIDSYLGLEYDVIAIEEATTLTYSKFKAIRTCLRTSKQNWRPRLYATTNPGNIGHAWFKKRFITPFTSGEQSDTRFIPSTVNDNAYVNEGYRKTLEDLTGWLREAWLHGNWEISAGQFFVNWDETQHVKPWFKVPENWRVWLSYDYGFNHYTVIHLCAEDPETKDFWVLDEHHARQWLIPQHVTAVKSMLKRNGIEKAQLYEFVSGADTFNKVKGQNYSVADTWQDHGFRLTKADMDRISGASEMLTRLGNPRAKVPVPIKMFITDRCPLLKETIPLMIHDPHRPEDVLKIDADEDGEGGDDAYDSARYGLMAQASYEKRRLKSAKNPFY